MPFLSGFFLGLLACGVLPALFAALPLPLCVAGLLSGALCQALPHPLASPRWLLPVGCLLLLPCLPASAPFSAVAVPILACAAVGYGLGLAAEGLLPQGRWHTPSLLAGLLGLFSVPLLLTLGQ